MDHTQVDMGNLGYKVRERMQQRIALACMIVMVSVAPVLAADTAGITAWGPVQGRVLDATTLKPLAGASVETWYENRNADVDSAVLSGDSPRGNSGGLEGFPGEFPREIPRCPVSRS